tara:strand:- start:504 stop:1118 length:615 start_codon:yes stop_codon:yes gene_type:complete
MKLIYKDNVNKYEQIYKSGQNHRYPNLNLVRIQGKYLSKNIGKTLDFGFGTGENLIFLRKNGHEMYGLEASKEALKIVKKKISKRKLKKKTYLKHFNNLKKLPFKNEFFDNIICLSVISLLKNKKNIQGLLKEFKRILKKNGKIVIDINGPKGDFSKNKNFYCIKNKSLFLKLLNGFKIESSGEVYTKYFDINDHEYIAFLTKV